MAALFETIGIDIVQRNLQNLTAEVLPLLAIALHQEAEAILGRADSQPSI